MKSGALHQAIYDHITEVMVDGGVGFFGGLWDDSRVWDDSLRWLEVLVPTGVVAVYYTAPQAADSEDDSMFPYITLGAYTYSPNDTKTMNGGTILFDVHLWHREPSPLTWMDIQTSIYDALQKHPLTVTGLNVIDCRFEDSVDIPDPDGVTGHVVNTFRITYFVE